MLYVITKYFKNDKTNGFFQVSLFISVRKMFLSKAREHQFDYCFEYDTNTKSKFVRISFDCLSKFNNFPFVYTTIYQKENDKNVYFGNFFFHWLEIEQINEILIEISKFELSIEKNSINQTKNLIWASNVYVSYVRKIFSKKD